MQRENVRISDTGHRLLSDKNLAERVADAIMRGKEQLSHGQKVIVDSEVSISLVTSLNDSELRKSK